MIQTYLERMDKNAELVVRCVTLNALVLWSTTSGFTVADCNRAPASNGKLWIDSCSNGTMSVAWDLRIYGTSRINPITIQYTCVDASQVNLTVQSSEFNIGNIKSSSTTIIQEVTDDLVCSLSLCHQLNNQFSHYTLGPTACTLGTTSYDSTLEVSFNNGQSSKASLESQRLTDISSATKLGQLRTAAPEPQMTSDVALMATYSPSSATSENVLETMKAMNSMKSTMSVHETPAMVSASLGFVSEARYESSNEGRRVAMLVGVGLAVSFAVICTLLTVILIFKAAQRFGVRGKSASVEMELRKAIASPSKPDVHLKLNQSVDSVATELDCLELSVGVPDDEGDKSANFQEKLETTSHSNNATPQLTFTTAHAQLRDDGLKSVVQSDSSGFPDYQDNCDGVW